MLRIAIMGGIGQLGRRLAEGWSRAGHLVLLGSRDPAATRARVAAWAATCAVTGHVEAVAEADLVVFATLVGAADGVAHLVAPHLPPAATVLSVMVPPAEGDPTRYAPPAEGSTAEHLALLMPEGTGVVAGFHTFSAGRTRRRATY